MALKKNCHACKHEHNSSSSDPCSTCDASYKWNLDDATYNNWEPKDEEPDCEKCKYEDKGPEEEPCQGCGIDGDNYFEPKISLRDEWCDECFYGNLNDDHFPCRLCLEGGIYKYFKSKEEKKMDNRKTKAQLMEELEQKNSEIAALKKELERSANYEQYLDAAKETRSMVDAFVESGFTEEQAITIVTGLIGQAAHQRIIR